ncbi:MAG: hypothetical protein ACE149_01560 [Armatimonadota bacterium]
MQRRLKVPVLMALALFAVLAAAAAFSSAEVSFRSAERDGARVGEVAVGERPVIVLRTAAGGYSPLERAEIVASRLRTALATEPTPKEVTVTSIPMGAALNVRKSLIVAIYANEANAHGATPTALARLWRDNLLLALGQKPQPVEQPSAEAGGSGGSAAQPEAAAVVTGASGDPAKTTAPDWTGAAQKWVPVFSLETEGARVGMAQIAGPTAAVERVKGVYELRLDFRSIGRIYAYIPVSTLSITKLERVQGVSVWALADIKVLGF